MKRILLLSTLAFGLWVIPNSLLAQPLKGIFVTEEEDGKIEFYQRGREFIGKLIWSIEPNLDVNNPEPSKRGQNTVGQEIFFLEQTEDNEWEGEVYDSRSGRTYNVQLWFENNRTLKIRGYIGHPILGQTETMYLEQ